MLENSSPKLLVYASSAKTDEQQLESVSLATEKMAKQLDLGMEVVTFEKNFTSIYVYYKSGEEEPIPIYCHKGGQAEMREVYSALRSILFVLSFHPKHSALKRVRQEVIRFS